MNPLDFIKVFFSSFIGRDGTTMLYLASTTPSFVATCQGFSLTMKMNTYNKDTKSKPESEYGGFFNEMTEQVWKDTILAIYNTPLGPCAHIDKTTGAFYTVDEYNKAIAPTTVATDSVQPSA